MTTRPRPPFRESAVIVLIRGHGAELETFWVRRSDAVSYMPGFEAFIGGSVDGQDAELPLPGAADERERVFKACAIREAFEETGVLVGLVDPGRSDAATLSAARDRLLAGAEFPALAAEYGWAFDAAALEFAGRWQTPPFASTRFDTLFFLARVPDGQEPTVHPGELASGEWIRPADALTRYHQGRAMFAAPILHTLLALVWGEQDLAARLVLAPEISGRPTRRIEMQWGVLLQPMVTRPLPPATHTNAYLVGEREIALIDPGSGEPAEIEALVTLIDTLAGEGRKLRIVLLTHHHPDHTGGVDAVRERYRVPVAAHAKTAEHLRIDLALKDGDWIPLLPGTGDWTLRAIATPGHTRDHLCYLLPRTRSLFCGDHIPGGRGTVIIDPPDGDMIEYLRSLERLQGEPVEFLFPGHGGPQGAAQRRIQGLIAHRLERERKVLEALGPEPRTEPELVERAYEDTPKELWGYAARSLLAHLLKLEAEGKATRAGERWARGRA